MIRAAATSSCRRRLHLLPRAALLSSSAPVPRTADGDGGGSNSGAFRPPPTQSSLARDLGKAPAPLSPNPLPLLFTDVDGRGGWRGHRFELDPLSSVPPTSSHSSSSSSSSRRSRRRSDDEERWNFRASVLAATEDHQSSASAATATLENTAEEATLDDSSSSDDSSASSASNPPSEEEEEEEHAGNGGAPSIADGVDAFVAKVAATTADGGGTAAAASSEVTNLPEGKERGDDDDGHDGDGDLDEIAQRFERRGDLRSPRHHPRDYHRPPRPRGGGRGHRRPHGRAAAVRPDRGRDRHWKSPREAAKLLLQELRDAAKSDTVAAESDDFDGERTERRRLGQVRNPRLAVGLFQTATMAGASSQDESAAVGPDVLPPSALAELIRRLPPDAFLEKYDVFRTYAELVEAAAQAEEASQAVAAQAEAEAEAEGEDYPAEDDPGMSTKMAADTSMPSEAAESVPPPSAPSLAIDPDALFDLCDSLGLWAESHRRAWVRTDRRYRGRTLSPEDRWDRRSVLSDLRDGGVRARTALRYVRRFLGRLDEATYQHECLPRLAASAVELAQQARDGQRSPDPDVWEQVGEMLEACSVKGREFPVGRAATAGAAATEDDEYEDEDGEEWEEGAPAATSSPTSQHSTAAESYKLLLRRAQSRREAQDVKFHRVLGVLVKEGHAVEPEVAVGLLRTLYPFKQTANVSNNRGYTFTRSVLGSIAKLQRMQLERDYDGGSGDGGGEEAPQTAVSDYRVDLGTLEHVVAGAGVTGGSRAAQLAWDVAEGGGLDPSSSEAMYEGTIMAFLNSNSLEDHMAFAVLADMERRGGFVPSRALLYEMGRVIGLSTGRLDNAYYILTNQTKGTAITVSSLNAIVAGSARLGDADRAFATLDDFRRYGVDPNLDTLVFLMEALAEDGALCALEAFRAKSRWDGSGEEEYAAGGPPRRDDRPSQNSKWSTRKRLHRADQVMRMADEQRWRQRRRCGYYDDSDEIDEETAAAARAAQRKILHHYVRILSGSGDLEGARELVELTATGTGDGGDGDDFEGAGVHPETLAILATRLARDGDFESARDVAIRLPRDAGYGDLMPVFLTRRIDNMERQKETEGGNSWDDIGGREEGGEQSIPSREKSKKW